MLPIRPLVVIASMVPFLAHSANAAVSLPVADLVGTMGNHEIAAGETLIDLARQHDLGYVELVAANPGVDPWLPAEGTSVLLPTGHLLPDAPRRGIVINLPELRLYYFSADGATVRTMPIGIGRDGLTTPLGNTRVASKREKPTWIPTKQARKEDPELPRIVRPGPDNPLGEYALYLAWPQYLIHGTNKPPGVGRRISRGCIRLYPEDIAELFALVAVGTPVTVVDQPVKLGWRDGELYLEVHPTQSQVDEIEERTPLTPEPVAAIEQTVSRAAGAAAARIDWSLVAKAISERQGIPIRLTH